MFRKDYSKWTPLKIYDFSGNKFLLQGQINKNTGEISFKNTLMNSRFNLMQGHFDVLDFETQFNKLLISE